MTTTKTTVGAITCPLCGVRGLTFSGGQGRCGACGFSGPTSEVARHVEAEIEKLRTRMERLVHERDSNTQYLLRELAEARRACAVNSGYMALAVFVTLGIGYALYPWLHSEFIYLTLICTAVLIPLVMKRRWLNKVLRDKEQDIGERIRDVAEDLDSKALALAAEISETEDFLSNVTGGT